VKTSLLFERTSRRARDVRHAASFAPLFVALLTLLAGLLGAGSASAQTAQLTGISSTDGGCAVQSGDTWNIQPGHTYQFTLSSVPETEPRTRVTIVTNQGDIQAWAPLVSRGGGVFQTDPVLIPAGFCGAASLLWGDFTPQEAVSGSLQAAAFAAGCTNPTSLSCDGGCLPVVTCPSLRVSADADQCSAAVSYPAPTITGGCTIASVVFSPPAGTRLPVGSHFVTCAVTAAGGQTAIVSFEVDVVDDTPPTFTCPAPTTVTADANCQATVPNVTGGTFFFDNCLAAAASTRVQSPGAGTVVGVGDHTITVRALDQLGNTVATCTTTFTVLPSTTDTHPPTVSCPQPLTLAANSLCQAAVPDLRAGVTASDDCTPASQLTITQSPAPGTLVGKGDHPIAITVTDAAGNTAGCSTTFTVLDTTPPSLSVPANQTVEATGPNGAVVSFSPMASDSCDALVGIVVSPLSGSIFPLGTTTVHVEASDAVGNLSDGGFTITVQDTTPPVLSLPGNIAATATSTAGAVVTFAASASDRVDGSLPVTTIPASGSLFGLGSTTVNATATDNAGNTAKASFNVDVTYAWSGFLQPINPDGSSVFKAGSTISVKFALTGASAGIANAVATFSYRQIGPATGAVNESSSPFTASAGTQFRYDSSSSQYVYNWSTKGLQAGYTYELRVDLGDGVPDRTIRLALR
jgi:hypothetical protein